VTCTQINFHTTLNGEATVSMLYHKALDEQWQAAARALRPVLAAASPSANGHVPHIIGRSRKQKVNLDQDYVLEKLMVHGRQYMYRQYEVHIGFYIAQPRLCGSVDGMALSVVQGSFSQPNAGVCEKMLEWAVDVTKGSDDHDLLVGR
jgi:tRNA (uracil-5-)-methyltransferase